MKVAVLGGTGFVGREVCRSLREQGISSTTVKAPRLATHLRSESELLDRIPYLPEMGPIAEALRGYDTVINCAGLARPGASAGDELFGANALLPGLLGMAASGGRVRRLVHVSSAAVLGRAPLRETWATAPETPYAQSKALGEALVRATAGGIQLVVHRPTSVHGPSRAITKSLTRLSRSPYASVASGGPRPSPQVLVQNVAAAICYLALSQEVPPVPTLQPSEGIDTVALLTLLSSGRTPKRIWAPLARLLVGAGYVVPGAWATAQARRAEMLWFGQEQQDRTWLERHGFQPQRDPGLWRSLGEASYRDV